MGLTETEPLDGSGPKHGWEGHLSRPRIEFWKLHTSSSLSVRMEVLPPQPSILTLRKLRHLVSLSSDQMHPRFINLLSRSWNPNFYIDFLNMHKLDLRSTALWMESSYIRSKNGLALETTSTPQKGYLHSQLHSWNPSPLSRTVTSLGVKIPKWHKPRVWMIQQNHLNTAFIWEEQKKIVRVFS